MKKSTPTNNNESIVFVTDYNWPIEEKLKGRNLVIRINRLEDIPHISPNMTDTRVIAYLYVNPYASLETIDFTPEMMNQPIVLYINRLGKFRNIHYKIGMLKQMNIKIIFTAPAERACTDAQILASLGIHSGVMLNPDTKIDDKLIDLVTYNFYNRLPHGDIEPFAALEHHYNGDNYVNPAMAYFVNPERYVYIDKDYRMAITHKHLMEGEIFAEGEELLNTVADNAERKKAVHAWQEKFITGHPCTFCPAWRVCMGYFEPQAEEGKCKEFMTEVLEGIEFQREKNKSNNNRPQPCRP